MEKTGRAGANSTVTASSGLLERPPHDPRTFGVRRPLGPGTLVGRYEVLEMLGEGSMGSVYRARDVELGRDVALKRINPETVSIASAEDRLRREARAMARVEHGAVVRIYDAEVVDGELFVAMELARGGTLAAWIAARPRSWREVVRAFLEAGRGLAAAHHVGVVHRDVKPSNILIDGHGSPKISDFGLARTLGSVEVQAADGEASPGAPAHAEASMTRTGAIVGTLAYMAPEQLAGEPIDARADQFAFCVALWEALCGHRPFDGTGAVAPSPAAMLEAMAGEPRIRDDDVLRTPRRVLAVIRRGLAVDRAQRWRSMDELLDALERAVRSRRVWWLAAAAAVGAAIAIAIAAQTPLALPALCGKRDQIAAIWNPSLRDRYLTSARDPGAALEDARWFDWYARTLDAEYAASCGHAEERRIACLDDAIEDLRAATSRSGRDQWPRLRAIDRCGMASREISLGGLSNGERVRLSPDGRNLLVLASGHAPVIRALGGSGGRPLDLAVPLKWLPDDSILGFSSAGRLAVFSSTTSQTRSVAGAGPVIDAAAEQRHLAFDPEDPARTVVDVSSDLRHIARIADGALAVVPVGDGAPVVESIAANDVVYVAGAFSPDGRRFASVIGGRVIVDDLASRHRDAMAFRLRMELSPTWSTSLRWLDATSFVISGSATASSGCDLWRLRVDPTGRITTPPQTLLRNERDTSLLVHDAQPGKLLFERAVGAPRSLLIDGDSAVTLPGALPVYATTGTDRAHHRVLVATDTTPRHWAWMSLDGVRLEPIPALDGLISALVVPAGLVALDLRSDPASYVALDDAGTLLARLPIPAPRGATPMLRCGASRCVIKWSEGSIAITAAVDGLTLRAPVRHDPAKLAGRHEYWDLSPDGTEIALMTTPMSSGLMLYDLGRSEARRVTSETCGRVEGMRYMSDGALMLFCLRTWAGAVGSVLVRRDPVGHERVLWEGDGSILAVAPLDDRRVVLFTISYQHQLALLEDQ